MAGGTRGATVAEPHATNEEVTADGRSERGNFPVFRKPLLQWMMRITAYADRLAGWGWTVAGEVRVPHEHPGLERTVVWVDRA